jgi:hypothetical protein
VPATSTNGPAAPVSTMQHSGTGAVWPLANTNEQAPKSSCESPESPIAHTGALRAGVGAIGRLTLLTATVTEPEAATRTANAGQLRHDGRDTRTLPALLIFVPGTMTEIEARLHELHVPAGLTMRVDAAVMSDAASGQVAALAPVVPNRVLGAHVLDVHADTQSRSGASRGFAAPVPAVPNHELDAPMLAGHADAEIGGAASGGAKGIKGACGYEWPLRWCHDDKPDVADAGGAVPRSLSKEAGVSSAAGDEHSSVSAHSKLSSSIDAATDGGQAEVTRWLVTFAAQALKHWHSISAAAHQEPKDMRMPMSHCVSRSALVDMSDGVCGLGVVSMPIVC